MDGVLSAYANSAERYKRNQKAKKNKKMKPMNAAQLHRQFAKCWYGVSCGVILWKHNGLKRNENKQQRQRMWEDHPSHNQHHMLAQT